MRQLTSRRAGSFLCFAPPFFASVAASALFSAACPFVPAAYKAEERHTASSTWNRHFATRVLSRLPPLPPPLFLVSSPHHRRRRRLSRMAAPSVVLVPPTPYDVEKFPPRSSSVSPRTTVTVASARSSRSSSYACGGVAWQRGIHTCGRCSVCTTGSRCGSCGAGRRARATGFATCGWRRR